MTADFPFPHFHILNLHMGIWDHQLPAATPTGLQSDSPGLARSAYPGKVGNEINPEGVESIRYPVSSFNPFRDLCKMIERELKAVGR